MLGIQALGIQALGIQAGNQLMQPQDKNWRPMFQI